MYSKHCTDESTHLLKAILTRMLCSYLEVNNHFQKQLNMVEYGDVWQCRCLMFSVGLWIEHNKFKP